MEKTDVLALTKQLISTPSYVGKDCNESKIADFLFEYCKKFKWLKASKQKVSKNRFNLILKDKYPTKLLICGHLDTVQPRSGWKTDPFTLVTTGNKLFGLGTSDMKGSIAALLCALEDVQESKGLMILFYVDEEYDFLGMKKFLTSYKDKLQPELIISADGYDLSIGNGCRGLIEITFVIKGQTGHAANPQNGINAIIGSIKVINQLTEILTNKFSSTLGNTTCNLAFLQGGLDLSPSQDQIVLGREGNNIANLAEIVLDIRPATKNLTAQKVIKILKKLLQKEGLQLINSTIRHDISCWITEKKKLSRIESVIGNLFPIKYLNAGTYGYIDTQMLWENFDQVPCITLGAGSLRAAHKPNEFLEIKDLRKIQKAYQALLNKYVKGGE